MVAKKKQDNNSQQSPSPQQEDLSSLQNRVEQLEHDKPLHEMIEAIYLELGRALHGISNITDSSLPEFLEQYSEKTNQQLGHYLQGLQEKLALTEKAVQETNEAFKRELEQKNSELDNLKKELQDNKSKLNHSNTELNHKINEINNLENELQDNNSKLNHSNTELNHKINEINNLENELHDKNNELIRLEDKLEREQELRREDIANLQNELQYKDSEVLNLRETLTREQQARQEITSRFWTDKDNLLQEKEHYKSLFQFRDYENSKLTGKANSLSRENAKLKNTADTLSSWIDQLEKGILTLLHSKRWKIGSAAGEFQRKITFRPKQPMPEDHLKDIIHKHNNWKQGNPDLLKTIRRSSDQKHPVQAQSVDGKYHQKNITLLTGWIEELQKSTNTLLQSKRWKTGNAVGELKRKMLLRSKEPMPNDYINGVFEDYNSKKIHTKDKAGLKTLESIMDRLEKGLTALINSSRWKTGSRIGNIQQKLLFRPKEPMPADHIEDIINKYRQWKTKNYF